MSHPTSDDTLSALAQILEIQHEGAEGWTPLSWTADGQIQHGKTAGWEARIELGRESTDPDIAFLQYEVTRKGPSIQAALQVRAELPEEIRDPYWMMPGLFYGQKNREYDNRQICPAYAPEADTMTEDGWCNHWTFNAERAAMPVVYVAGSKSVLGIATSPALDGQPCGLHLSGAQARPQIGLTFPHREEPVVYTSRDETDPDHKGRLFAPAERAWFSWDDGQARKFRVWIFRAKAAEHAYAPFVRWMYAQFKDANPTNPWMSPEQAAHLTAGALHRWHYHAEDRALYETALFDREANAAVSYLGDRPQMHLGWVSGIPYAWALIRQGDQEKNAAYREAGRQVIDHCCEGIAPPGCFYQAWEKTRGWIAPWSPDVDWAHARTCGEASWFLAKALVDEKKLQGSAPAHWEKAFRSNLDFACRIQNAEGNLGMYYHVVTGEVMEREGEAALMWIPALLAGADYFGAHQYAEAAVRAGDFYIHAVRAALIQGAPEDVNRAPTSEDGYAALIAYLALYEYDHNEKWLTAAKQAADWLLTFRWAYNTIWPQYSILNTYDMRSFGGDNASGCNQHLHVYGLVCLPELIRLYRITKDAYYLQRAQDNLDFALQFIAREDGDFNAYQGMVTERYYHTRYIQKKGMFLTLSHAWCIGMILLGCQEVASLPELLVKNR